MDTNSLTPKRFTQQHLIRRALVAAIAAALLVPAAASAATQTFTNSAGITIPQQGQGNPYPSTIGVSGLTGPVTDVDASVNGLSHICQPNVDLLLVGPGGQRSILYSDSGRCDPEQQAIVISATFDDEAASTYPCLLDPSGTFRPTDDACEASADVFSPIGPAGPHPVSLAQFDGGSAEGTWSLFAVDDSEGDAGSIASWSLTITTEDPRADTAPPDTVGGPKCFGKEATIEGTRGEDRIVGTPERDVIFARAGDDVIKALGDGDIVCAGRGKDRVKGGGGPDKLSGGAGRDSLSGGAGKDRLFGGTPGAPPDKANDRCVGGGAEDSKRNCEQGGG
jgi:Ca2+-binding RTX toxin-like protein